MDDIRVKDVPGYLTEELFERLHVEMLMREIDKSIVPAARIVYDGKHMWISPAPVENLLSSRKSQVDSLGQLCKGMSFLQ